MVMVYESVETTFSVCCCIKLYQNASVEVQCIVAEEIFLMVKLRIVVWYSGIQPQVFI